MLFVLRRNNIGPDLYVICSEKAPGTKPVEKPSAARFAHPLRGAEVLVAVRGPSPGGGVGVRGQRKNVSANAARKHIL